MPTTRRDCLRAALGAAALLASAGAARSATPAQTVAWPALTLLDGTRLEPAAWQGTPAIVVLWATWCPFCKRHNAHLEKLHRALAGRAPRILAAAIDTDAEAVRRYMADNGYTFPVTAEGQKLRPLLTTRRVVPLTFVVDRAGRVRDTIAGEMFEEDVFELAEAARAASP
jgi:thiol-disulfide isomerase/thioredoxin